MNTWEKLNVELQPGNALQIGLQPEPSCGVARNKGFASQLIGQTRVRLLEHLADGDRDNVLRAASHRRFRHESVVTRQDEPATHLFLLIKGAARYFAVTPEGQKVYLLWLAPGEIFGGASLLPECVPFLVNTEVTKGSEALMWDRKVIQNLCTRYTRLLQNSLSIANDYLTWYLATHLSLISNNARQRLARVLVSLARGFGRRSAKGVWLNVTNEQLANTANITLFTTSRLMSEWQRKSILQKSRGKVLLCSPNRLFTP